MNRYIYVDDIVGGTLNYLINRNMQNIHTWIKNKTADMYNYSQGDYLDEKPDITFPPPLYYKFDN